MWFISVPLSVTGCSHTWCDFPPLVPEKCLCCFDPKHFYLPGMKMEGCGLCFPLGSTNTTVGEKASPPACLWWRMEVQLATWTLLGPLYSLKWEQSLALLPFLHLRLQGQVPLKWTTTMKRGKREGWPHTALLEPWFPLAVPTAGLSLPSVE